MDDLIVNLIVNRALRYTTVLMSNDSDIPLAYLITFPCYGTWLHGDERGSVDDENNLLGAPFLAADAQQHSQSQERMTQPAYCLDSARRRTVLAWRGTSAMRAPFSS